MISKLQCPVCGYGPLGSQPWEDDEPSDEICPCCGTHFGYDDFATTDEARNVRQDGLRKNWIASGCPWFSKSQKPPPGWNPAKQLSNLECARSSEADDNG